MKKLVWLIISILIVLWFFQSFSDDLKEPVDSADSSEIVFEIESGQSARTIAANLEEINLIRDAGAFEGHARSKGLADDFKVGKYPLARNMNGIEIMEVLTGIKEIDNNLRITIPEGFTSYEIDDMLVNKGLIESGEYLDCVNNCFFESYDYIDYSALKEPHVLEGYLYPDTYFMDRFDFNVEDLIQLQLDNFDRKISPFLSAISSFDYSLHELIIMASIVEKEVFGEKDMRIVAGILWKRLESDWTIGADATLLYLAEDRELDYYDLQEDNDYNTRKFRGLPPTAISNPSIDTIEASLNFEDSDYWFYLTTLDTGEVIYGRSNEEHNRNKSKYLN